MAGASGLKASGNLSGNGDGKGVQGGFPAVGSSDEILAILPSFDRGEVEDFHPACSVGNDLGV